MLAFLPGAARNPPHRERCSKTGPMPTTDIVALYGALDGDAQDRAIAPAPPGRRKIVLATSIAETSITIEGVRIVVDCGLARVPRYEPDVGVTRLETVRVSRAAADQRARPRRPDRAGRLLSALGRAADRVARAVCPAGNPRRRSVGVRARSAPRGASPSGPAGVSRSAAARRRSPRRSVLRELGAIDGDGRITEEGKKLRRLPLPPRLARMVIDAAAEGDRAD